MRLLSVVLQFLGYLTPYKCMGLHLLSHFIAVHGATSSRTSARDYTVTSSHTSAWDYIYYLIPYKRMGLHHYLIPCKRMGLLPLPHPVQLYGTTNRSYLVPCKRIGLRSQIGCHNLLTFHQHNTRLTLKK